MTHPETARILAMLAAVWTTHPITEATIGVYHATIGHLPLAVALQAAEDAVRTMTFFPKPAELLAVANERGQTHALPDEAWAEVMRRVKSRGVRPADWSGELRGGVWLKTDPDPWSTPELAQAVESVGYRTICHGDKPEVLRAQFVKAYERIVERSRRIAIMDPEYDREAVGQTRIHPLGEYGS